jgi:hypothetical protein
MKPPSFKKTELFCNPKLVIRRSTVCNGWGVFTTEDIEPDEILQEAPYFLIDTDEVSDNSNVITYSYGMHGKHASVPLGFGGLYNHSETPNAENAYNEYYGFMIHFATEFISAGSEIFIDYGVGDPKCFNEE